MSNMSNPIRKRLFELDMNQTELGKRLGRSSAWTIPLHCRCRCVLIPKVQGIQALGLSHKDLEEAARPYSIKEGKIVGLGGKGKAIDAGTWKGSYESWLNQLSPSQKKDFLGPKRLELINSGKIKFPDLVDIKTGRLRLLTELTN